METIPKPTIIRLCALYQLLDDLEIGGTVSVSSTELGLRLDTAPHNLRKDISYLGEIGSSGAGYDVKKLKEHIGKALGFGRERKACVIGLGRLGQAVLQNSRFTQGEFRIVAGFDSNINKVETMKTAVQLFPAFEMVDVIKKMGIDLALIAVPPQSAQDVANRIIDGGIRGILNFTQTIIKPKCDGVFVRNVDIMVEFRILSALMRAL